MTRRARAKTRNETRLFRPLDFSPGETSGPGGFSSSISSALKIALEDEDGGKTVPNGFPLGPAHPSFKKGSLGRHSGQPLVPHGHRDAEGRPQNLNEGQDLFSLGPGTTIQAKGEANHHLAHPLLRHEQRECLQVMPEAFTLEGRTPLGREPKVVAQGKADGPIPYV
jgi:hypothetical protein